MVNFLFRYYRAEDGEKVSVWRSCQLFPHSAGAVEYIDCTSAEG